MPGWGDKAQSRPLGPHHLQQQVVMPLVAVLPRQPWIMRPRSGYPIHFNNNQSTSSRACCISSHAAMILPFVAFACLAMAVSLRS